MKHRDLQRAVRDVVRPRHLRLEASSSCQLSCPSCPTASGFARPVVGNGFLLLHDFETLVDENPWVRRIELSNYGEMFLNPDLASMLEYAHSRRVSLTADNGVNFNTVSEDVLNGLVRFGFRSITCSINGAGNETYRMYHVNGDFHRVIENIRRLNQLKEKHRSQYPLLTWQFVVMGHNEHEIAAARQLASDLHMRFSAKLTWDDEHFAVRDREHVRREIGYASRDEFWLRHHRDYMQQICHQLWDQPQVNWDGKVLGCCRNFWGDFGSNAFRDGLFQAINSERMRYARGMLSGTRVEGPEIPCTSCDVYLGMKTMNRWLRRGPLRDLSRVTVYISHLARRRGFSSC